MTDMMAAQAWRTNAHMLADLFRIMPPPKGEWIDLTYGEEGGWSREPNTPPDALVRCIGPDTVAPEGVETVRIDFRATAHGSNRFALTCFEPPYVLKGGKGKFDAMNTRYGVGQPTTGKRKAALTALIEDGLTEAARITRPGGWILAKSGRGVDGAKLFPTNHVMTRHAETLGLELVQELVFLTTPRSQKHRGPQKSPRSNYSILHVFEVAS